jgi:hypothetical protein
MPFFITYTPAATSKAYSITKKADLASIKEKLALAAKCARLEEVRLKRTKSVKRLVISK